MIFREIVGQVKCECEGTPKEVLMFLESYEAQEKKKYCTAKNNQSERPPLGIYPRFLHDEKRMEHIAEAIERFTAVGKAVPLEWIEEYDELAERVQKRKVVRE